MSGAARRRGRGAGRAQGQDEGVSETTSRRGDRRGGSAAAIPAGAFDGPASRGSGSGTGTSGRPPSRGSASPPAGGFAPQAGQPRSRTSSLSASRSQPTSQPGSAPAPPMRDPALDPANVPKITDALRNVDLPASFFNINREFDRPNEFKTRPGYNNTGKQIQVAVNAYPVVQYPTAKIYQFDVVIGNGAEKRIVLQKVWNSPQRKQATGQGILFDGNRLAWGPKPLKEIKLMVDLDVADGRPSRGDSNAFRVRMTPTRELDVSIIRSFLDGNVGMDIKVAEAINFMDHLLREGPSNNPQLTTFKRSFFSHNGEKMDLGGGVQVVRGVYQSMRLAEGKKLIINVDVANTTFWNEGMLTNLVWQNMGLRDVQSIIQQSAPQQSNGTAKLNPAMKTVSSRFKGTLVVAEYKGNLAAGKEWKILRLSTNNADQELLEWKDPQTKKVTGEKLSVTAYFKRKYNLTLQFSRLPLVEMTKKGVKFPMEFLRVLKHQRYGVKLDEKQTANMIKFAVSPPQKRLEAINNGKNLLNWGNDNFLNNYGLKIDTNPITTNARLLPAPGVKFATQTTKPGTRGRWDLKGQKFLLPNPNELSCWGVGVFPGRTRPDKAAIDKFVMDFSRAYRNHGGKVANAPPHIAMLSNDPAQGAEQLWTETGNKFQKRPQLLVFLVQDKNSFHYTRIKKSCDSRRGVVSQVLQLQQILKGSPQYYSNVLMKVNAKLGGTTALAVAAPESGFKGFKGPTMFIGADVSHASPGSEQASMAAITVSFDKTACRYLAACETNGHRVEMISEQNWSTMLGPLAEQWTKSIGGGQLPQFVYYMRDGVSEGQFAHVMNQEVPAIKAVFKKIGGREWTGKLTVVVASKRHHVRAFPQGQAADPKGNPLPGCLIERDVTSPNEWDFYMYSHIALQGTSRPCHYTVLYDDAGNTPATLQNMIYEHCYQYMRSTTSVSLHPAVYYAHLASVRAGARIQLPSASGPQGGAGFKANRPQGSDEPGSSQPDPLLALNNQGGLLYTMWYI